MTLHHLAVFCAVCQDQSMSKAAIKLNMTQPGVSRIISELEKHYGVVLFLRKNRTLHLTSQGLQSYEDARKVLKSFSLMEANLKQNQPRESLSIGCSTGIASLLMPEAYKLFKAEYPYCILYVTEGTSKDIQKGVLDGKFSFGLIQASIPNKELTQEAFCQDKTVMVCSPEYQLQSDKEVLSFSDLTKEKLILTISTTGIRTNIENYALKEGVAITPIWSCTTGNNALNLAKMGYGIALLSDKTVSQSIKEGSVRSIPLDFEITRDFFLIWRKDNWPSEEETALISDCRRLGKEKSSYCI